MFHRGLRSLVGQPKMKWSLGIGFSVDQVLYLCSLVFLSIIFIFGTIVNILVLIIFYRRPSLRSISNRFVLSLTTANLISSMIVAPAQGLRIGRWVLSSLKMTKGECLIAGDMIAEIQIDWLCQSCRILTTLSSETAILSVLMIAIDRYCAVTSPLHYSMTVTRGRSGRMISVVWGLSLFYTAPLLIPKYFTQNKELTDLCWPGVTPKITHHFSIYYSVILGFCGFTVPFLILVWIYIKMYRAAMKNSERTRRHSIGTYQTELLLTECQPPTDSNQNGIRCKSRIHRKRSSNSSISSLFFREEGRAVKTGVIVIFSFITSWMPYYTYKILESLYCFFPHLQNVVILMALSSSCTMPFIYVYRNESARKEAIRVICWWRDIPATPTYFRPSIQTSITHGNSSLPVRIVEPKTGSMYTYTTECEQCGENQLVSTLKSYRPMSIAAHELRRQNSIAIGKDSAVSFKLNNFDKPGDRCESCARHDSESSASSDDPLIGDRFRFPRHNPPTPVRWMKHRLSTSSMASTNSSLQSYNTHKWPRRCSTVSTESGGTPRKNALDESHDSSSASETPKMYCNHYLKAPSVGRTEEISRNFIDLPPCHGYPNPFPKPYLYPEYEYSSWPHRYIWEIEECDGADEDSVVLTKETYHFKGNDLSTAREMEDIHKLKDVRRSRMFRKRFSQQEIQSTPKLSSQLLIKPMKQFSKEFPFMKNRKNSENKPVTIIDSNQGKPEESNNITSNTSCDFKTNGKLNAKQSDL